MGPICNLNSNRIKKGASRDHILSWIKNAKTRRELRWSGRRGPSARGSRKLRVYPFSFLREGQGLGLVRNSFFPTGTSVADK